MLNMGKKKKKEGMSDDEVKNKSKKGKDRQKERDRETNALSMNVSEFLHPCNVWWKWVTVTDSLISVLFQTACWVKHSAVMPHSDEERVKTLCNVTQSAPSAILIIAQINEGRELVSVQCLCDVTN